MNIFKSEYMNSKWLLFHIQKRKKKKKVIILLYPL